MYRGSNPRIVPIIVTIVIVALVISAVVALGRMMFGGSSSTTTTTTSVSSSVLDTSSDRSIRWTVRGPIVAYENFRSYQITILARSRSYTE